MIPVDVAACVHDLVTRVISDAAGDYPGVHTREGVIGDRMATAEDIVELQNAELAVAQREAVGAQAAAASAQKRCAEAEAKCAMLGGQEHLRRTWWWPGERRLQSRRNVCSVRRCSGAGHYIWFLPR